MFRGEVMGILLSGRGCFSTRMFLPLLLRQTLQFPFLHPGQLRRQLSRRRGRQGTVPATDVQGGLVQAEPPRAVRHARQRLGVDRHAGGLFPGDPGRRLELRLRGLPGGASATRSGRSTGTTSSACGWPVRFVDSEVLDTQNEESAEQRMIRLTVCSCGCDSRRGCQPRPHSLTLARPKAQADGVQRLNAGLLVAESGLRPAQRRRSRHTNPSNHRDAVPGLTAEEGIHRPATKGYRPELKGMG